MKILSKFFTELGRRGTIDKEDLQPFEFRCFPTKDVREIKAETQVLLYTANVCLSIYNQLETKGLGKYSVRDCIKHLSPFDNHAINEVASQCLQVLFQYAKEQKYIEGDATYDKFISLDW